jgi:hypothetical protein
VPSFSNVLKAGMELQSDVQSSDTLTPSTVDGRQLSIFCAFSGGKFA